MLSKYAAPDDDGFKAVSSHLLGFAEEARRRRREKGELTTMQLELSETNLPPKVSLRDDPHGLQVAKWLMAYRPEEVQHLDIETLVYEARRLEKWDNPNNRDNSSSGSILGKLSQSVQSVVGQSIRRLSSIVSSAAIYAAGSGAVSEKTADQIAAESGVARKVIHDIEESMAGVRIQTRDALLLEPNLLDTIDEATIDEVAAAVGAKPALDLRQNVLGHEPAPDAEELELPRDSIRFRPGGAKAGRFQYGFFEEKPVVIERIPYTPVEGSTDVPPQDLHRVRRMVARLSHPERTSRHVLRCAGYVQDRFEKQIGLVFYLENGGDTASPPAGLHDLYHGSSKEPGKAAKPRHVRVPLGLRFKLAHSLAVALEGLHRVGWMHKGVESKNLVFFPPEANEAGGRGMDAGGLDGPYLFGFEWARPEDAETDLKSDFSLKNNAYRHPNRWGKPNVKFTKAHDVYSLGVVLLELACWKSIFRLKFKNLKDACRCEPEALRREMLKSVREDIPHLVGQSFAAVVETCLRFDEITEGFDELRAHEEFKEKVVGVLRRLATAEV
ncbi:hypothetical protein DL767_004956 [Monosporascus sp. MG133]|nr:hypothetical protein DL767_004956 [Monosporascus sp. MG133]